MAKSISSIIEGARQWLKRGYFVVPVPFRKKAPTLDGWPELRLTATELSQYFNHQPSNLGVLLGAPYGATDIDLDSQQALRAWAELGPETGLVFGRSSAPASHHFFRTDPPVKTVRYVDPLDKDCLLELRCLTSDGGIGLQTVVPPSTHESGEQIRFDAEGETTNIDADILSRAAAWAAAAALLAKYWPAQGSRNAAFLALAGTLARAAWSQADACIVHRAVYRCLWPTGPDFTAAAREVEATYRRFREGREITGFQRLSELIDRRLLHVVMRWLDVESEAETRILEFDARAVAPEIASLNGLKIFSGLLQFASFRERGPVIVGTLTDGTEIIWRSSNDLIHFTRAQTVIADATGAFIASPPKSKTTKIWEPVADLILRIANRDSQPGGSSLAEEFRELLPMVWARAGRPCAELPEDVVAGLKRCTQQARNPQAEPPMCCVWKVYEGNARPDCWVHLPSLLGWLSAPVAMGRRYDWAEAREALWLLGFRYAKDTHRSAEGRDAKASVWIGPVDVLRE